VGLDEAVTTTVTGEIVGVGSDELLSSSPPFSVGKVKPLLSSEVVSAVNIGVVKLSSSSVDVGVGLDGVTVEVSSAELADEVKVKLSSADEVGALPNVDVAPLPEPLPLPLPTQSSPRSQQYPSLVQMPKSGQ
jgi:hypothetical protein